MQSGMLVVTAASFAVLSARKFRSFPVSRPLPGAASWTLVRCRYRPALSSISSFQRMYSVPSAAMTFQLASIPADVTNLKLIILASEPQGNGITRAYSKAAAFDSPVTPVTTAIDIKAKYDAKNGAPSAGYPKVFFKYFYVNTATGEKSGEKMASAVLSE